MTPPPPRANRRFDWKPPTLETQRLVVRPLSSADADGVFAYAGNPNMTHYTLWDTHRDREESLSFVRDYVWSRYADREPEPVGVALRERPDWIIGTIGCFWVSRANSTMELGYALAEEYWGRGLVAEASAVLLHWVFGEYPVERVQARVISDNFSSTRVLAKLGFKAEGTLRSSLFRRGRFWDVNYYSTLRGEWEARH